MDSEHQGLDIFGQWEIEGVILPTINGKKQ
jgi:hypothetical protein